MNLNKVLPFGFVNSSKDKWCKSMHCWYYYGYIEIKELRTPCYIFSPIVDGDVMDSVDIDQVYPPNGGLFAICWDNTLASCPIQFRFISIYSVTGVRYCVTFIPLVFLVCRFVLCNVNCLGRKSKIQQKCRLYVMFFTKTEKSSFGLVSLKTWLVVFFFFVEINLEITDFIG